MLPHLNANPNTVTVSGFSAGCYMSHKLSIIYSETIKGAGMFACWPYAGVYDGQDRRSVNKMANRAKRAIYREWHNDGECEEDEYCMIDDPANIADQAIYIWGGTKDDVVAHKGQKAMKKLY